MEIASEVPEIFYGFDSQLNLLKSFGILHKYFHR